MKTKIVFTFCICMMIVCNTSAQYFEWAHELPFGWRGKYVTNNAVDHSGNVYTVGSESPSFSFSFMFVQKESSSGNYIWQYTNPSHVCGSSFASNIAVDYQGNVFISGGVSCGYLILAGDTIRGSFLLKLNSLANEVWVLDSVYGSIAADSAGSVYVTNNAYTRKYNKNGILVWNKPTLQNADIGIDGSKKCYIINADTTIKFNANGTLAYTKNYGGNKIAVNKDGTFFTFSPTGLRKYNAAGNLLWTNPGIAATDITTDNFNAYVINGTQVSKVNNTGSGIAWTLTSDNAPFSFIAASPDKNVYVCGNYDASTVTTICPFKLADISWLQNTQNQSFTAKINTNNPPPFQAGIITGLFNGFPDYYLCNLTTFSIPYNVCFNSSSSFNANNEFRAQISNDNFATYTDIGLANAAQIPLSVPEATNYRIRIVSTSPAVPTTYPNSSSIQNNYLEVRSKSISISGGNTTFCSGDSVKLTATSHPTGSYHWLKDGIDQIQGNGLYEYYARTTGAYACHYFNSSCDTISNVINVTVKAKPQATITPQGPTTFCAGGNVVLSANSGTGFTYQWKKGANIISGATLQNYTATVGGVYRVQITNANGCTKLSAGTTVTVNCRQIFSMNAETQKLFVYPSPVDDVLNIELREWKDDAEIKIYSTTGHLIKSEKINLVGEEINYSLAVKDLSKGIYSISIVGTNNIISSRFLKQ